MGRDALNDVWSGPIRVMIVDDTPDILEPLQEVLALQGYEVFAFACGTKAIKVAETCSPHLILLDVCMPDMNGYEVCKRLKAIHSLRDVPVIFLSGLDEKAEGFEVGGEDYISKPFRIKEVAAVVEHHLRIYFLQQSLGKRNEELEKANTALQELHIRRDMLVHMLVHDLRSPLQVISLNLQVVGNLLESENHKAQKQIHRAARATHTLIEMVSSVLDVNKMEMANFDLHLSEFDISGAIAEVLSAMDSGVSVPRIVSQLPSSPVTVKADREIIERVVWNLVSNAIQFSPSEETVLVVIENSEQLVRISVSNKGPGIPPEHLDKVFEKFWTGKTTKHERRYSTGLGLTFCKMVVEAHGGTIGVSSEVGVGSTFRFEIPKTPL